MAWGFWIGRIDWYDRHLCHVTESDHARVIKCIHSRVVGLRLRSLTLSVCSGNGNFGVFLTFCNILVNIFFLNFGLCDNTIVCTVTLFYLNDLSKYCL